MLAAGVAAGAVAWQSENEPLQMDSINASHLSSWDQGGGAGAMQTRSFTVCKQQALHAAGCWLHKSAALLGLLALASLSGAYTRLSA